MPNIKERLSERIAAAIRESALSGVERTADASDQPAPCITFRDYMNFCLYDEQYGYYRSGQVRVGRGGDFYTSSSIGAVMGDKLAAYTAKLIGSFGGAADAAEWGAGTGRLSGQIIAAWRREGHKWLHGMTYTVVDGNPVHLTEAMRRLQPDNTDSPRIRFHSPEEALKHVRTDRPLIVAANELLDAFPVHRVIRKDGRLWELGVALAEERSKHACKYVYMEPTDSRLAEALARDGMELSEGQIAEVNLAAEEWLAVMSRVVSTGALILIDYGHEAAELAAPHRMNGTLLCYRQHIAGDNPFDAPGGQDMTAHVNFTACRRAAAAAGWKVEYMATQKQFLIDNGVLDDLVGHDGADPFSDAAKRNRAIRQLLLSDGMSEAFKVLALTKRQTGHPAGS